MAVIGLDLRPTEKDFKAHLGRGTGRYTTELVKHLFELVAEGRTGLELRRVGSKQLEISEAEKFFLKLLPFGRMTFSSQVLFPRRIRKLNLDLIHFFAHGDAPAYSSVPQVVTVLDLIPLRFPELYRARKSNARFRFARFLEYQSIRRSKGLLAISESTKQDLIELLGVEEDKIIVTHLGVGEEFLNWPKGSQEEERIELRKRLNLPLDRPLLLYVGGIDPRKNVPFLVDVCAELLKCSPEKRPLLALAGSYQNDDQYPGLLNKIERAGLKDDVRLLGFVPDLELPKLYRSADLLLFASLYEGFGFPVLEAMASGLPVIAANNSSIPEVGGESVLLLEDGNLGQWVTETAQLLASAERLEQLGRLGRERAKLFSWRRSAEATWNAYNQFLRFVS